MSAAGQERHFDRLLPVSPDQRTSTHLPGWSGSCQQRKSRKARPT